MAAIITEQFRKENADLWLKDLSESNYYIGIGQQHRWAETEIAAPYPLGTYEDQHRVLEHLTSLFKVSNQSIMIPNVKLEAGVKYKVYDPMDPNCFYPDKSIELYQCFAIRNDIIYLCIHKDQSILPNGVMSDLPNDEAFTVPNLYTTFDSTSLSDGQPVALRTYGVKSHDGYTWAYLGETDKFNLLNSKDFVAVNTSITPLDIFFQQQTTFARAYVNPTGQKNDFIVTASSEYPGDNGNVLAIELIDAGSGTAGTITGPVQLTGQTVDGVPDINVIQYTFTPGTTAGELVDYLSNATNFNPTSDRYFTAVASAVGQGIGELSAIAPVLLSGGNTGAEYIRAATGGLVHGFTILNGGKNWYVEDNTNPGPQIIGTVGSPITGRLTGTDEFGNARTEDIGVIVEWYNDLDDSNQSTDKSHILNIWLAEAPKRTAPDETNINRLDDLYHKLRGWKDAKLTLPEWNSTDPYQDVSGYFSDPVHFDPCGNNNVLDVRVHIAPPEGFGFDKTLNLPTWYVGLYTDTCIAPYIPEGTKYHQISLVKNPLDYSAENLTGEYYQPLGWFELNEAADYIDGNAPYEVPLNVKPGWTILQDEVEIGILSHIQYIEDNEDRVSLIPERFYYYHSHTFGYTPMLTDSGSGTIRFRSPNGEDIIDTEQLPKAIFGSEEYQPGTGRVVFQDNRDGVVRDEGQNEEIKLVIQL